jgi:hypothetical protein
MSEAIIDTNESRSYIPEGARVEVHNDIKNRRNLERKPGRHPRISGDPSLRQEQYWTRCQCRSIEKRHF